MSEPRGYIRYELVDFTGKALSKTIPARHKDKKAYMYSGMLAAGANAEVLTFPEEVNDAGCPNCELLPDWDTLQTLPWASDATRTVQRVYCSQGAVGGGVNQATPREVCKRMLEELRSFEGRGLELMAASELEFQVLKRDDAGALAPVFQGVDIFATLQNNKCAELMYAIEANCEPVGVDILTMNAEYGAGQLEITMAPAKGIASCDNAATYRTCVKELAQQRGLLATFFSYPMGAEGVGNGGHFNFSLWEGEASAMQDVANEDGMSETAQHFLAGVLAHASAMEALCAPTESCYSRHGHWAPSKADWGIDDRMRCVRVKSTNKEGANCYMELRLPSASACPYLIVSALIAAGLDGLKNKLPLAPKADEAANPIPTSLEQALTALEGDEVMTEALGETLVRWYSGVKRAELAYVAEKVQGGASQTDAMQATFAEFV